MFAFTSLDGLDDDLFRSSWPWVRGDFRDVLSGAAGAVGEAHSTGAATPAESPARGCSLASYSRACAARRLG